MEPTLGTGQALIISTVVAGFVTRLLKDNLFPRLPREWRLAIPVLAGAAAGIVVSVLGGVPWQEAIVVCLGSGPASVGLHQGAKRAREAAAVVAMCALTQGLTGCAAFPRVTPYAYDDGRHAGAELCAGLAEAAAERATVGFYGGVAASVVGGAGLATLAAIPDGNLKAGDLPGSAMRAGVSTLAGGLVALGVYAIFGATDADELAAQAKNALMFDEGERPGEERDQTAWSMCLDAWGSYDDAGAARRTQSMTSEP